MCSSASPAVDAVLHERLLDPEALGVDDDGDAEAVVGMQDVVDERRFPSAQEARDERHGHGLLHGWLRALRERAGRLSALRELVRCAGSGPHCLSAGASAGKRERAPQAAACAGARAAVAAETLGGPLARLLSR